jgi:KUP system potassium uptake protein
MEDPKIPGVLSVAVDEGLEWDIDEAPTYFLSRVTIRVTGAPGMRPRRKRAFVAIWRNAASPVQYFSLPDERTITVGWQIALSPASGVVSLIVWVVYPTWPGMSHWRRSRP